MIHLRCLLGLHRTEWVLVVPHASDPAWIRGRLQVRTCRDCRRPIRRQHS